MAAQSPEAGQRVAAGSDVTILIASGNVEVPDVVGLPEQAAWNALQAAGFQVQTLHVGSTRVPAGLAADVRPSPGVVVPSGSRVTLVVSQGT